MRTPAPVTLVHFLSIFAVACGGGGDKTASGGGLVGIVTGTPATGPVPADGTSMDAPTIANITIANPVIKKGEALRISVAYADIQGDLASANLGIAGEGSHTVLALSSAAGLVTGTLMLEIFPKSYVAGAHVLNVSLTDKVGHVSAAVPVAFTIADASGGVVSDKDAGVVALDGSRDVSTATDVARDSASVIGKDAAKDVSGPVSGSVTFIMGSYGDSTKNEAAGLVKVTVAGGVAQVQPLTELVPHGFSEKRIDYRKGRVAMIIDPAAVPASTPARGNIVAFDLAAPKTRWFVPIPKSGTTGFHYTIDATRAQLLDDGRVVVTVIYQSDDIYEDYKPHMLALWDPVKDTIEVQGVLDSFVLGQPEVKSCDCDAEFGTLASSVFAVSRDGKYAYFSPMSAGTAGSVHGGPAFLARWDLVNRTNERIAYTANGASPWAVSDDGTRVVVAVDSKTKSFDPVAQTSIDTESSAGAINVGQVFGSTYIRSWRGCDPGAYGGVGLADTKGGPGMHILDAEKLPSPYRGIDVMSQFSADGKSVYVVASTDRCTNDYTNIAILQVPIASDNTANAVKLAELEVKYDTYTFVRVDP
jgi:hypothetical protein